MEAAIEEVPFLAKTSEVADFLRCSQPQVRELIREKKLHAILVGRSLRIPRESVSAFIAGSERT